MLKKALHFARKAHQIVRSHGLGVAGARAWHYLVALLAAQRDERIARRVWQNLIANARTGCVFFPRHAKPLVSIVIPVFNNARLTAACLNSILRELDSLPCEVIVVDDASTDGTAEYLEACSGIRVITHVVNQGFVQSANDGAAAAQGKYVIFLNNDTLVTRGWIAALLRTFESRDRVGAVGSQLRAPDGRISEAGGIIWRDGRGSNYGRGRRPNDPGVSFPREVDFCSGASLMVRADVFREAGGFSHEYAPAYYEDADLCFRLREAGWRVMYQPESVVVHFEGATAGKNLSSGVKRHQSINRERFAAKWRDALAKHYPPDERLVERAARRIAGKKTALVMDSFVPFDDRSAGGRRSAAIVRLMRRLDWHVIFIADDGSAYEPYAGRLRRAGIEVIPHAGSADGSIKALARPIDVAWICRADILTRYLSTLRAHTNAKIIFDTVDLHYLRRQREEAVTQRQTNWQAMRDIELDLARKAEQTVVTSDVERELLRAWEIDAHVIPIVEPVVTTHAAFNTRRDILFLGNYTHEPNADAARWLAEEIMPLVWQTIPTASLILAGSEPTPAVMRLAGDRIRVTGYVADLRPLFDTARVFVAPLRFGAGMKGKIVQSLAHGLPVITTAVGAEGIGLTDAQSALLREDAAGTAAAIATLYNDEELWRTLSREGLRVAQHFAPERVQSALAELLEAALEQQVQVRVDPALPAHSA